ncbi:MAG TPA: hypothetical protein EYP88_00125 [Anaerolineales bacterium]|nr:hypothetical protein [Anaerolineales bacterium]
MQLTSEILQKFTAAAVEQLLTEYPGLLAIYQCGSTLLPESPLLGGTTDIDLVLIHARQPLAQREIRALTTELHLDIAHHPQDWYLKGRELRVHPWMGPTLNDAKPLHDPRHFLDFTQASVRGMFHRADFTIQRARALLDKARQTWMNLVTGSAAPTPATLFRYLKAIENAANAVALLSGAPLTERRLLLAFPGRAEAAGQPQLSIALLGLLGAPRLETEQLQKWLLLWDETLAALPETARSARLHPARRLYYLQAIEAILGSETPQAALWPLLITWTRAANALPDGSPALQPWQEAVETLGLLPEDFGDRLTALDAFLDRVTEIVDQWEGPPGY